MKMPPYELVREALDYDPDTGVFTWRKATGARAVVGAVAGCKCRHSKRIYIRLGGKRYPGHRVAFVYMTGTAPPIIDHIDGDPSNNRWSNLRPATLVQNNWNSRRRSDSSSGFKGVTWNGQRGKWRALIKANGRLFDLGHFSDPAEAARAYAAAAVKYHGEFARFDDPGLAA